MAACTRHNMVYVWKRSTGRLCRRFRGPLATPLLVKFSPHGRRIACAALDRTVRIWDVRTRRELNVLQIPAIVHAMAFMHAGRRLLTGDCSGRMRIWRLKNSRQLRIFRKKDRCVHSVLLTTPAGTIYSGGDALRRWNLQKGKSERKIVTVPGRIHLLRLVGVHRMLMQDGYRTARLVDLRTGVSLLVKHYAAADIASRACAPGRRRLFLCFAGSVHSASTRTLRLARISLSVPGAYLNAVSVSHDGLFMAAGPFERSRSDRSFVAVWRVADDAPE